MMLNSKLFAGIGGLLLLASPVFPQHAPGFLIAGGMSGAATWIVGEKEREVGKRNAALTERERLVKSEENKVSCLIEKYERSLTEIERKQNDLATLQTDLDLQRTRCAFIESLRPQLEQREREVQAFKSELDRVAGEQKDRHKALMGWSNELEQLENQSQEQRQKLVLWTKDLEYQSTDLDRQKMEVQQSRDSFSEMLKAYQSRVWEELQPQAQAYAESIIAQRQKPLEEWREELKATEEALDSVIPGLKSELETEIERIKTQWSDWAQNYQEDCNAKIRAALDDRNSAHDTWKNHFMALAGKAHQENQQLRKVIYSPGRHWYELQADRIIEFLNFNEIAVDYYQSLPTPDERGFYVEVEPKYGKEALPEVYTKLCAAGMKEALKGIVTDCKQKPGVEIASKRIKLTFVMSSPAYVSDLQKTSGMAASSQVKDEFKEFLSKTSQVAILGATGGGKTELLKNIVGAFSQELGEDVNLIITNGKASRSSRELGIAKYNSVETAIFGLLEAAVEITYRIKLNEEAELENPDDPPYPDHEPIIYLFDEYSEIATKWNSVSKKRLDSVVEKFSFQLDVKRRSILANFLEDVSPRKFASTLLNTVWRLGRSEKVRVIVAGQNLQAAVLGVFRLDLWNPAFICIGDLVYWGIDNRAQDFQKKELREEFQKRIEAGEEDESHKFFGLFCAPNSRANFANLPAMGKYKYSHKTAVQNQLEALYRQCTEDVSDREADSLEPIQDEDVRSVQGEGESGLSANMPIEEQDVQLSPKDRERLTLIQRLHGEGKKALKDIIHVVWSDVEGVETYGSRPWRKARKEYRRLIGK